MTARIRWWLTPVAAALALFFFYASFPNEQKIKDRAEQRLHVLEEKTTVYLDSIHRRLHSLDKKAFVGYLASQYRNTFDEDGIACFIYENDSLQYWTDNRVAVENYMLNVCLEKRLVRLKNGYYEVIRHPGNAFSPYQLYGLILVKNNFPYENKYLKNDFNKKLRIPAGYELNESEQSDDHDLAIRNKAGQEVFGLYQSGTARGPFMALLSFFFTCLAVFSFLFAVKKRWVDGDINGLIIWFAAVVLMWFALWWAIVMEKMLVVFSPVGANILDFNILVFLLTGLMLLMWSLSVVRSSIRKRPTSGLFFPMAVGLIYAAGCAINFLTGRIFSKPFLAADLADVVFSSSMQIYLNYILIFFAFFCFVMLCEIIIKALGRVLERKEIFILLGALALSVIVHHFLSLYDILTASWPVLLFLLMFASRKLCANNTFLYGILTCLFISFFVSYLTIDRKNKTDADQRLKLARELESPKDEIVENLFASVQNALLKDKELVAIIQKKDKVPASDVEQYVLRKYFTGYWDNYHVSVCAFDSLCFPLVQHAQHLYNNNTYFDELISSKLRVTGRNLYFNEQDKEKTFYLFKTPLATGHKPHLLYIVIESKKMPEYRGFPDLLLNRSSLASSTDYSYAIYKNGQLFNKQGRFDYPSYFNYPDDIQESWMVQKNDYNHLVYKPNAVLRIVVSKNYRYYNDLFSTIGFLFLASSTIFLLGSFIHSFAIRRESSLSVRIQHYAAIGIFALFIPVAFSTISLVKKQIDSQNTDAIKEKTQTVTSYLLVRLADYDTLTNAQRDYVSYLLAQASGLFKCDLTLFYSTGEYYATSLPKLFEEGLISKKLNPLVYAGILRSGAEKNVINESIGSLDYYSAYGIVKNKTGRILCIVNLPYFARQSELQSQLFGYLSALLNIYVLAFMIVSVSLSLLANWLTRPLRQLQNELKQVGLSRQDHSIKYDRKDEIGTLITAYNTMLLKLKESADKLARSEREGAWKEMARQVAHEIKNPLTPMKLSIQHVQRLMETNPKEAESHIKRITPILLEQIDALSHIATEFSTFWQLPAPKFESIELNSFVSSLLPLYNTNPGISFLFSPGEKAFVKADKDQLLRVLNNLVNNAVQAISEKGEISIGIKKKADSYILSVHDNGKGIDNAVKEKIFQPNFSTKSYGTGLGLAMCKRIVEQHGGEIWFESESGKGTAFFVSLPAA
jgi:signal transduction histidine kinase